MAFMEAQVTDRQYWLEVETDNGSYYLPDDLFDSGMVREWERIDNDSLRESAFEAIKAHIGDYVECGEKDIRSVEMHYGYGVRLSAPGYMDCTDWEFYANRRLAERRAREMSRGE
jgi:hypothetical protein